MMPAMRKFALIALVLGAQACSSPAQRNSATGGSGGEEEGGTGGNQNPTGGKSGTGGAPGTGGKGAEGTGGATGGSGGGEATGGSGGATGGSGGGQSTGGSGGATGGSGGGGATGGSGGGSGAMPKVVLLYSNDHPDDGSQKDMMAILNGMKDRLTPEFILDDNAMAKAGALMGKGLVIVGPNTRACGGGVDTAIANLPIPVMISKDCTTWSGLGAMMNTGNTENSINIMKADHPLAAGLPAGKVRVFTDNVCRLVRGGGLGPDAIKIANFDANTWNIFAYEKGGMMAGGKAAPAKRVGFYWHRPSGATPEGKKLFEAAVDWLLKP
jgi:hypothetical protein